MGGSPRITCTRRRSLVGWAKSPAAADEVIRRRCAILPTRSGLAVRPRGHGARGSPFHSVSGPTPLPPLKVYSTIATDGIEPTRHSGDIAGAVRVQARGQTRGHVPPHHRGARDPLGQRARPRAAADERAAPVQLSSGTLLGKRRP